MANATDPFARTIHGTNPQNLIEKIVRLRVYASRYWKEHCFGLTAETLIDQAAKLDHFGGTYSSNAKPTRFMCLLLKLLQIQPDLDVVQAYLEQEDLKYLRVLGAFYLRLTGRPFEIYAMLEPLLSDYRKLAYHSSSGWSLTHMDEAIDDLLSKESFCDVAIPRLPKRDTLVATGALSGPRVSGISDLLEEDEQKGDGSTALPATTHSLLNSAFESGERRSLPSPSRNVDNRPAWSHADTKWVASNADNDPKASFHLSSHPLNIPASRPREEEVNEDTFGAPLKKIKYAPFKLKGRGNIVNESAATATEQQGGESNTEFWNSERAKLGLPPLR